MTKRQEHKIIIIVTFRLLSLFATNTD